MTRRPSIAFSLLLAGVLALLAGPALALGLGQLTVKSQPGQPLVAEIPIISSDPSELENLQARLASPDTFRRVGLQPPDMEVSGLQFAVALDARGNPVIRVTSAAPLTQPLLTFLLEVDWGEGRLVREYSTLVDAPRTVAAPLQPIQAPTVAPSNTIVRAPEAVAVPPPPATTPPAAVPAPAPAAPPPPAAIPVPPPAVLAAEPASAPTPAPPPSGDYAVHAGDTLSEIAAGLQPGGYNLDQTMLALLRANPGAFIGDNINRLKAGAVLRMPQADELSRYSAGEAAAVVRTQVAQWREARAPQQQPAAVARVDDVAPVAKDNGDGKAGATSATAQARLEIVPPSSGRGQAGTRSGMQAGGEGDMLRQQELQETRETLAARDAEVGDLKARVAELEKLQQQQQQLIAMKDSALAAAQQNLAKANTAAAQPAAQATTQQPAKPVPEQAGSGAWLWIGLVLLVAALAGWLLTRRRAATPKARVFDAAALAASVPTPVPGPGHVAETRMPPPGSESEAPSAGDDVLTPTPIQPPHWTAAPALVGTVPTWHGATPESPASSATVGEATDPARQLELARAYLDLGDDEAARELLREVLDGRDPAARETAARMLRDL